MCTVYTQPVLTGVGTVVNLYSHGCLGLHVFIWYVQCAQPVLTGVGTVVHLYSHGCLGLHVFIWYVQCTQTVLTD